MTVLQDSYKPRPRENKNLRVLNTFRHIKEFNDVCLKIKVNEWE